MRKFFQKILTPIHATWSFYAVVFGIIFGIALGIFAQTCWFHHWIFLLVASIVAVFFIIHSRSVFLILAFLAGAIIGNYRVGPDLSSQAIWAQMSGNSAIISGRIAEDPEQEKGIYKLKLDQLQIQQNSEADWQELSGKIYVQLVDKDVGLERSDIITISGKVGDGFGIYSASLYKPELQKIQRAESGDVFARLKNWFASVVREFLPAPESELGLGYLMGLKNIPDDLSETLRVVGMTHVVVASGTHLGILVDLAKKIFGRLSKFAGAMAAMLLLMSFVLIVGFTPSMTRAALVASFSLIVGYVGRRFTPLRLISLVAAITLLISPTNIINLGWQLSFGSFFGILILAPRLQKLLYGGKKPSWLANMLLTSFSTTVICLPILIYNFGTVSLLSFVANLIILPTLPYAMLLVFLTGTLSFVPFIASFVAQITKLLLDVHISVVNILSQQKTFIFELSSGDLRIYLIYLPILISLISLVYLTRPGATYRKRLDSS